MSTAAVVYQKTVRLARRGTGYRLYNEAGQLEEIAWPGPMCYTAAALKTSKPTRRGTEGPVRFEFHERMTVQVLKSTPLPEDARRVVLWGNWSVDYYNILAARFPPVAQWTLNHQFHFAGLVDGAAVEAQWDWLDAYARRELGRPQPGGRALYQMGKILHAVQDFYAHSNWMELTIAAGYPAHALPTWEERPADLPGDLYTFMLPSVPGYTRARDHGRMHKDSPDCPAGPDVFQAMVLAALRATEFWWLRLYALLHPTIVPRLSSARPGPWAITSRWLLLHTYIDPALFTTPIPGLDPLPPP